MNEVEILIISNKFDFTTDYITHELHKLGIPYVRINRDEFSSYGIKLSLSNEELYIKISGNKFIVTNENLKSVYFRAPTFLRDLYVPLEPENQLFKSQWASFIRNLIIFENALWINHPVNTYKAENKLFQLKVAKEIGFKIPFTLVSNNVDLLGLDDKNKYAIKTLDAGLFKIGDKEAFIYTNIVKGSELTNNSNLRLLPVVIQEYLYPKLDVRVTVVGNKVWAVKILKQGKSIDGDWRRTKKEKLEFISVDLPHDINLFCITLVKKLGLNFGAIDLAYSDSEYFFLEINPTGEWAWLVNSAGLNIYKSIAKLLYSGVIKT